MLLYIALKIHDCVYKLNGRFEVLKLVLAKDAAKKAEVIKIVIEHNPISCVLLTIINLTHFFIVDGSILSREKHNRFLTVFIFDFSHEDLKLWPDKIQLM